MRNSDTLWHGDLCSQMLLTTTLHARVGGWVGGWVGEWVGEWVGGWVGE